MAALLAGCGNTSDTTQNPEVSSESKQMTESEKAGYADTYVIENYEEFCGEKSAEGKKIGITLQSLGNDFMVSLSDAITSRFAEAGIDVDISSCDGDSTTQVEQIENYISMDMDAIVAFPVNGESLVTAMESAEDAGIPTVSLAMDVPSEKVTSHIIASNEGNMGYASGKAASDWINENFPDAGAGEVKVLMLGSTSSPELDERSEGMEVALRENEKIQELRQDTSDANSLEEGRNATENIFLSESYDVIVAVNSTTALGADSYLTSPDSPIEDLSKTAIFTVDDTDEIIEKIIASENNESLIRGTVSMGSVEKTADTLFAAVMPILTGGSPIYRINGSADVLTVDTLK